MVSEQTDSHLTSGQTDTGMHEYMDAGHKSELEKEKQKAVLG